MANIFSVNVYQINQNVLPRDAPVKYGFPSTGVMIQDVSASTQRSLSSGYNVYSLIIIPAAGTPNLFGTEYYVAETFAQLLVLIG